jgi:hypothetical protein
MQQKNISEHYNDKGINNGKENNLKKKNNQ